MGDDDWLVIQGLGVVAKSLLPLWHHLTTPYYQPFYYSKPKKKWRRWQTNKSNARAPLINLCKFYGCKFTNTLTKMTCCLQRIFPVLVTQLGDGGMQFIVFLLGGRLASSESPHSYPLAPALLGPARLEFMVYAWVMRFSIRPATVPVPFHLQDEIITFKQKTHKQNINHGIHFKVAA